MKKVLSIAGVSLLTITSIACTPRTSNSVAEQSAKKYESAPNWVSWTKCYVNNMTDLKEALPSWVPSISQTNPNGGIVNYKVPNLEAAGRLHYVLYGYDENRILQCPESN